MTTEADTATANLAREIEGIEDEVVKNLAMTALSAARNAIERAEARPDKYVQTQIHKKLPILMKDAK